MSRWQSRKVVDLHLFENFANVRFADLKSRGVRSEMGRDEEQATPCEGETNRDAALVADSSSQ